MRHSLLVKICQLITASLLFVWVSSAGPLTGAAIVANPDDVNEKLSDNLEWAFGGKTQKGWKLYLPLITSLLTSDSQTESRDFSKALAEWQRRSGLQATGILDQTSWMKMVGYWQSRRSGDHTVPSAGLVTVPSESFFDSTRPAELRQVEAATYAAYQRMAAAAIKELGLDKSPQGSEAVNYFKIISAFRSPEYQRMLRAQSPGSGRAGLAVNSPHFTGKALDIYVGGEPVSTRDQNRQVQTNSVAYRWLVRNAARFGFIPYFYEPWHWEYNPTAAQ